MVRRILNEIPQYFNDKIFESGDHPPHTRYVKQQQLTRLWSSGALLCMKYQHTSISLVMFTESSFNKWSQNVKVSWNDTLKLKHKQASVYIYIYIH